ncbi:MAG: phosphopyruvate hydratase [Patescibacteria group bacterium]|nr:phosphopyruvate hydratase [Patescibacteria group bacterium]
MKKFVIEKITAREILDSRGNPTVETTVILDCGIKTKASVPSGASTGEHEAFELRDNDKKRYGGLGVLKACASVEKISRKLKGMNILEQKKIDEAMIELDGTDNKSKFGANAILSVSLACARAGALVAGVELYEYLRKIYELRITNYELPIPMFNIFNGGKHADTNLNLQEFMIVPIGLKNFSEQLRAGAEIFHALGEVLKKNHLDTDVGNEGGYAPNIDNTMQAFDLIMEAIVKAGYKPGAEVALALDVGASELYDEEKRLYTFDLDDYYLMASQLISLYRDWATKYPIISIEDGLAENSWEDWEELTKEFARFKPHASFDKMLLVGDDFFTTNAKRLEAGVKRSAGNAVILKPNQIGTLSEAIEFAKVARENNYTIVVSHRSGETCDDFIADLAVAISSEFVKFGSLSRGERVTKYNRLLEIFSVVLF